MWEVKEVEVGVCVGGNLDPAKPALPVDPAENGR